MFKDGELLREISWFVGDLFVGL